MAPFRYAGMLGLIAFAVCAGASPIAYATTASGESAASGETATMQRIVDTFERIVTRVYQTSGHGVRGAHAKGQGCVHATVRVAANVAKPYPLPCDRNFDWANGLLPDLRLHAH